MGRKRELKRSFGTLLLVHRTVAGNDKALDAGAIEGNWAKTLLVLGDVVGEDVQQRLGLLRTEVNALKVVNAHLVGGLLGGRIDSSEDQEEVPDREPNLHAVGVGIAIIRGFFEGYARVVGLGDGLAHACPDVMWCGSFGAGEGT